jgi:hypothetical protein
MPEINAASSSPEVDQLDSVDATYITSYLTDRLLRQNMERTDSIIVISW